MNNASMRLEFQFLRKAKKIDIEVFRELEGKVVSFEICGSPGQSSYSGEGIVGRVGLENVEILYLMTSGDWTYDRKIYHRNNIAEIGEHTDNINPEEHKKKYKELKKKEQS